MRFFKGFLRRKEEYDKTRKRHILNKRKKRYTQIKKYLPNKKEGDTTQGAPAVLFYNNKRWEKTRVCPTISLRKDCLEFLGVKIQHEFAVTGSRDSPGLL